jgi:hypothetical protein
MVGGLAKLWRTRPGRGRDQDHVKRAHRASPDQHVRLIQNAFFQAILPVFELDLERVRRA